MNTNNNIALEDGKNMAVKYLNYGDRTEYEVFKYLKSKNVDESNIKEIIEYLIEMKYIDDNRYARQYIEILFRKGKGKNVVVKKMKDKGLDKNLIKQVLEEKEFYTKENQIEKAEIIKNKIYEEHDFYNDVELDKKEKYKKQKRIKEKVARKLASLGYDTEVIINIIS